MKSWLINLCLATVAVFAPIQGIITTVLVLIILDMILGVLAAKKRGEKISSAGLRRTVSKFFIYEMAILAGFLIEIYLIGGMLPVSKLIAGIIGVVELKSLLESLDQLNGSSLFADLIKRIGSSNDVK